MKTKLKCGSESIKGMIAKGKKFCGDPLPLGIKHLHTLLNGLIQGCLHTEQYHL